MRAHSVEIADVRSWSGARRRGLVAGGAVRFEVRVLVDGGSSVDALGRAVVSIRKSDTALKARLKVELGRRGAAYDAAALDGFDSAGATSSQLTLKRLAPGNRAAADTGEQAADGAGNGSAPTVAIAAGVGGAAAFALAAVAYRRHARPRTRRELPMGTAAATTPQPHIAGENNPAQSKPPPDALRMRTSQPPAAPPVGAADRASTTALALTSNDDEVQMAEL
eukprot:g3909.t1